MAIAFFIGRENNDYPIKPPAGLERSLGRDRRGVHFGRMLKFLKYV
jgi:hypothetical protein